MVGYNTEMSIAEQDEIIAKPSEMVGYNLCPLQFQEMKIIAKPSEMVGYNQQLNRALT